MIQKRQIEQREPKPDLNLSFATQLRLERMKMPTFNENIRQYSKFKTGFMKQVLPEFVSGGVTAYLLRSCLGKMPYEIVKNIGNNLDEI